MLTAFGYYTVYAALVLLACALGTIFVLDAPRGWRLVILIGLFALLFMRKNF